jgi:hypothetical protein
MALLIAQSSFAQDSLWSKSFGGGNGDWARSVQQTSDGGFIIVGYTDSFGAGGRDIWLIKTDSNGVNMWSKTFGGTSTDEAYAVRQTSDGGYIIAGGTSSFGDVEGNYYLIKTDSAGDTLWTKTYGGIGTQTAYAVEQTDDDGYICCGYSSTIGMWLIKIDSLGGIQWANAYTGEQGTDVHQTSDRGFIMVGHTSTSHTRLIKTDSLGEDEWNISYGDLDNSSTSVIQTSEGGYAVTGYSGSFGDNKSYLFKMNSAGDSLWFQYYDSSMGYAVMQTTDDGYVIGGNTYKPNIGAGLIRIDSLGRFGWSTNFGGQGFSCAMTAGVGFILAGIVIGMGGSYDYYLVKTEGLPPAVGRLEIEDDTVYQNLINHTPEISWKYYDLSGIPQDGFEIAVGSDNNWPDAEMWNPSTFSGPDTSIIYAGDNLIDGETYYLRMRVSNGETWSEWFYASFRMNSLPTVPMLLTPKNDVVVNTASPTLYVNNSADAEDDSLTYDFGLVNDSICGELLHQEILDLLEGIDSTGAQPWTLDENCRYWWAARVFDQHEYSEWSTSASFWINAEDESPLAFDLQYPPDTGWSQVYEFPTPFWWGVSRDPDPYDSVYYRLLITTDSIFSPVITYDSIYETTFSVPALNYSTHYWWKVQAVDISGNMTESNGVADFMTWILGDANRDYKIDIGDVVFIVNYLYRSGNAPSPVKTGDVNADCIVDPGDFLYLINYIFRGGMGPKLGCAPEP